ncbi:MAG: DMT family transporter [Planctomycetaceae bacterium]|nr:DMT family transporter [Planctomycetaceae bacterium]
MKSWQAECLIFIAAAIWGLSYVFVNEGMNFASPALFLTIRFALALLITFFFFGCLSLRTLKPKTWLRGLFLGMLFGGAYLLQTYAIKFTDIPKAAFITALVLPATPFVSLFLLKKPITVWNIAGVILAVFGVYLLVDPDLRAFTNIRAGDVIALCSVPLWAFYLNYIDIFTSEMEEDADTPKMLMLQFIGALPVLLAAVLLFESPFGINLHNDEMTKGFLWNAPGLWKFFLCIGFLSLLGSFVLTFLQTAAQKYTTPVKAMIIFQCEPIIATVTSVWFYNETFGIKSVCGCCVILTAVLISELGGMIFQRK